MTNYSYPNPQRARKKVKGLKIYTGIITVLLVALLAVGITMICTGYMQFGSTEETETETDDVSTVVEQEEDEGITLAASGISRASYELYSVSYEAESAYTITATITPAVAATFTLSWTVGFADGDSNWASRKTVTDYVDIAVSDDTMSATAACYAAFGEQIVITAAVSTDETIYGTTTVDYVKSIYSMYGISLDYYYIAEDSDVISAAYEAISGDMQTIKFTDEGSYIHSATLQYGSYGYAIFETGTITPDIVITSLAIEDGICWGEVVELDISEGCFAVTTPDVFFGIEDCDDDDYNMFIEICQVADDDEISGMLYYTVDCVYNDIVYSSHSGHNEVHFDASELSYR